MRVLAETSNLSPLCNIWSGTGDSLRLCSTQNVWWSVSLHLGQRQSQTFILGHSTGSLQGQSLQHARGPVPKTSLLHHLNIPRAPQIPRSKPKAPSPSESRVTFSQNLGMSFDLHLSQHLVELSAFLPSFFSLLPFLSPSPLSLFTSHNLCPGLFCYPVCIPPSGASAIGRWSDPSKASS